jgi:hypothetical protein
VKRILEKLLENRSSKNLAGLLIDNGAPYTDREIDKLANLIRKWKQTGKVPKKWEPYFINVAEELGIKVKDEKDELLIKCCFINILKDIKIAYYENKKLDKSLYFIFFILMFVFASDKEYKEFVNESIEREWGEIKKNNTKTLSKT